MKMLIARLILKIIIFKIGEYIYSLVAPFNTITDEISKEDLEMILRGETLNNASNLKIMMTEDDLLLLNSVFEISQTNIIIVKPETMLSHGVSVF